MVEPEDVLLVVVAAALTVVLVFVTLDVVELLAVALMVVAALAVVEVLLVVATLEVVDVLLVVVALVAEVSPLKAGNCESSVRLQPEMSVSALGHWTCSKVKSGLSAFWNQSNRQ